MILMQTRTPYIFVTILLFFFTPTSGSFAESVINCHCFQDRTYNHADPFAADDYILATSFNSFLAKSFDIPKRQIVMLKMKEGVGQNDLLIGLKTAKATKIDLRQLLRLRREKSTWSKIISELDLRGKQQNDRLLAVIKSGIPVAEAGAKVADELIADFFKIPMEMIGEFRLSGLNEKEIVLLLILAHTSDQKPETLVARHVKKGKSWSGIADSLGVQAAAAGKLILQYPAKQITE